MDRDDPKAIFRRRTIMRRAREPRSDGTKICPSCSTLDFLSMLETCRRTDWASVKGDCLSTGLRSRSTIGGGPQTPLKGVRVGEFVTTWEACRMCYLLLQTSVWPQISGKEGDGDGTWRYPILAFKVGNFYEVMREGDGRRHADMCSWRPGTGGYDGDGGFIFTIGRAEISTHPYDFETPYVLEHEEVLGLDHKLFFSILKDGTPEKEALSDNAASFHRKIDERVNIPLVKHWLNICQTSHPKCDVVDPDEPEIQAYGLKVIDCKNKSIISAPPQCEYLALSYVWGRREVIPFEAAPQVILDAMEVVLSLGKQYLWADKYCIDQFPKTEEEKEHKKRQLDSMAEVYEQAYLTIVAGEGATEDHGLCGISQKRESLNIVESINGASILVEDYRYGSWKTAWTKRGWTLQEGLLPRRLLFFFKEHVYFECLTATQNESNRVSMKRKGYWCEAIHQHKGQRKPATKDARTTFDAIALDRFWNATEEYSTRSLSFDGDGLLAFGGALKRFAHPPRNGTGRMKAVTNLLGLPISRGPAVAVNQTGAVPILLGLSWYFKTDTVAGKPRRRTIYEPDAAFLPSWTWAAWDGSIKAGEATRKNVLLWPLATVEVPFESSPAYLRMEASIHRVKLGWDGRFFRYHGAEGLQPGEKNSQYPYIGVHEKSIVLPAIYQSDIALSNKIKDETWDVALLYSYRSDPNMNPDMKPSMLAKMNDFAFIIILNWLDEGKTKAERIGALEIRLDGRLFEGEGKGVYEGERRKFELY